jgi:hypothetical protein
MSLKGKIMFPVSTPGSGIASILHIDDPVKNATEIADLVKKGYMVRTFADRYNNGALLHGPSQLCVIYELLPLCVVRE